MSEISDLDRKIYELLIGSNSYEGFSVASLAKNLDTDVRRIRHSLASSSLLTELCYRDSGGNICPLITAAGKHYGLEHFSWFYSNVCSFLSTSEEIFMERMLDNSVSNTVIGKNRCSIRNEKIYRCSLIAMIRELSLMQEIDAEIDSISDWEVAFHNHIRTSHGEIKASCDTLLITSSEVYLFYFIDSDRLSSRMENKIWEQAKDYTIIFGQQFGIYPTAVLINASRFFCKKNDLFVSSRDMLIHVLEENMAKGGINS